VDVRPALRQIAPRNRDKTGTRNGPYGPW
jgi:hypothetical protein